jgi:hypothetical protein
MFHKFEIVEFQMGFFPYLPTFPPELLATRLKGKKFGEMIHIQLYSSQSISVSTHLWLALSVARAAFNYAAETATQRYAIMGATLGS